MNSARAVVAGIVCAACVLAVHAQAGLAGKWQGETGSGRLVVLDLRVKGQQLTGSFTLGEQTADISDGQVGDKTFSFKVTIEGRSPLMSGEMAGDQVKLSVEGVPNPVMLKRAK
jgi:hypothetical protein